MSALKYCTYSWYKPELKVQIEEYCKNNNIEFELVDISDDSSLKDKYGINYVPTLILIREGKESRMVISEFDEFLKFITE